MSLTKFFIEFCKAVAVGFKKEISGVFLLRFNFYNEIKHRND